MTCFDTTFDMSLTIGQCSTHRERAGLRWEKTPLFGVHSGKAQTRCATREINEVQYMLFVCNQHKTLDCHGNKLCFWWSNKIPFAGQIPF